MSISATPTLLRCQLGGPVTITVTNPSLVGQQLFLVIGLPGTVFASGEAMVPNARFVERTFTLVSGGSVQAYTPQEVGTHNVWYGQAPIGVPSLNTVTSIPNVAVFVATEGPATFTVTA